MSSLEERRNRKEWYLEESAKETFEEGTIELLRRIFSSVELEENLFNKDVSEFSDDEAIDFLKSLNSKSRARLKNTSWYLSKYHEWCYNKGVIQKIDDPFDDRTIDKIIENIVPDDIITSKIIDENYFKECVDLEPDYVNKFIAICDYYGIRGNEYEEMLNLKMEDLDEENKRVKLITGRIASVDDYFIEHMKKAATTENYVTNKISTTRNYKHYIYTNNGYVIRPTSSTVGLFDTKPATPILIKHRSAHMRKTVGNEFFTMSNLYNNGLINFIKKKYAEKNISLKTAITQQHENDYYYVYDAETSKYIEEFGSNKTVRLLRMEIMDFIDKY